VIIIADDLTGANDTGVQFVKQGLKTVVYLTPPDVTSFHEDKVSVVNTDSRSLSAKKAYEVYCEFARKLNNKSQPFIYKKVDSTLRGNIGYEIDGLMDELPFSYCAFAPAYPKNGRMTIGGYHLVHGELLEDTELAKDVKFPMTESFIPHLLAKQSSRKIGMIGVTQLRGNELAKEVQSLLSEGVEIIVFDSATDADLQAVADFLKTDDNVLWVGSAGLANAYSTNLASSTKKKEFVERINSLPTLTIAGSISNITREQIAYQQEHGAHLISIHPLQLLKDEEDALFVSLEEAKGILASGQDVVITTQVSEEVSEEVQSYIKDVHIESFELGNMIASKLGQLAGRLIEEVNVSGLILTGGDIAYQTCLRLGIDALEVVMDVDEGIPLCRVVEGAYANTAVVTKAGAFGQPMSLQSAMSLIKKVDF
jgi:uncharacterized protein YgbK (DUF1537 family)